MNLPVKLPAFSSPFGKKTPPGAGGKPNGEAQTPKTTPSEELTKFAQGMVSVPDVIAPSAIEVDFDHLKINNTYFRTLFVAGYPRFVAANWLSPLINFDHSMDISMFVYPIEGKSVLDDLRRKIAEMEAEISTDIQRGKIVDPSTQAKLEDARALQEQLVKGTERFFQFGLYVTIPATSLEELDRVSKQVESTLGSLLIVAKHATLQMEDGFKTTLPLCVDKLKISRNMDTTSLATTFPFTSSELTANEGIMYGLNEHNGSLVIFDRFTLENANSVIFAKSGAGKSLKGDESVLVKERGAVKKIEIGSFIESLIESRGFVKIDEELEGVIKPGVEIFTFNKELKGEWAQVTVAARKKAPPELYRFTTASGRQISTTADHNLITLKKGQVQASRSDMVQEGDYLPLPRHLPEPAPISHQKTINLLKLLKGSHLVYVKGAAKLIKKYYPQLRKARLDPKYDRYLYNYTQGRCLPLAYFTKILEHLDLKMTNPLLKGALLGSMKFKKRASLPLELKLTPEFFRLLGYFVAEGGLTTSFIHISQQTPKTREDIKNCLRKLNIPYFETRTAIIISARVFVELIRALGMGTGAATKRLPTLLFNQGLNEISSFLKGYFEGDGTVNNHDISATSKSKELISDLVYLLLYFGIVARIKKQFKRATNSQHQGDYYYRLVISGVKDITRFVKNIGFLSGRKNKKALILTKKAENTNVDVIPGLETIFEEIYQELYSSSEIPSPYQLSPLKRNIFRPSPGLLKQLISKFEERIKEIEEYPNNGFGCIQALPKLETSCQKIAKNKDLNAQAWKELGSSWQLMKTGKFSPGAKNVFRLLKTVNGFEYSLPTVKEEIYHAFTLMGDSLRQFDISLWTTITQRPEGDTAYERLVNTKDFLKQGYQEKRVILLTLKKQIEILKFLANSDLFWDPIVKIEKMKNKDPYVYDLTVDNEVFLAGFGGMFVHNSYLVKLEALRSLMFGTEILVLDPEAEYQALAEAVGGEYISFGFDSPAKVNPFDLSTVFEEGQNELGLKILSLHSLFKVIMGQLTASEEATLDRALVLTYKMKGITPDPATQKNEPPLMEDLYKALIGMEEPEAKGLGDRVEKFVKGSFAGVFDQRSTVEIRNPFTVFSLKELEEALRPIAMFIILDFIWNRIKRDMKKRILVVDEAWYLMKYGDSASFLYSIAKRARKYWLGLTTITQDVEDFLVSDYGKAIVTNSSIQILMKQSPAGIDKVAQTFYLSEGEKHLLLASEIGEGLFFAGANHVAIKVIASPEEHQLITTNPEELVKIQKAKEEKIASSKPAPVTQTPSPTPEQNQTEPPAPVTPKEMPHHETQ